MVRRLVYVQVAVGQGRLSADDLLRALKGKPDAPSASERQTLLAGLAPASGLTLVEVRYDDLV
jgi:tRNA U38,U39,U40 pseudouridine synthase TruA